MSVTQVEKRIREDYDGQHLLDALPPHDSLEWTPFEAHPQAHIPVALVLGTVDRRDIVAFFTQSGDKAPEIRYCSKPRGQFWSADSVVSMTQDYIVTLELRSPFKYNAGTAKIEKRKFSYILKWYFMIKGLLDSAIPGNLSDWCKIFYKALRAVESQMPKGNGRPTRSEARERHNAVQESPETAVNGAASGLRSGRRTVQDESVSALATASSNTHQSLAKPDESITSDYDTLCDFLDQEDSFHLLRHVSEWKKLDWYEGKIAPDSLPYKLLVGKTNRDKANIYAHVRAINDTYVVQFWSKSRSDKASGITLPSKDIATQNVIHPFDKTYGSTDRSLFKSEEERLEILVKWYFIASGKIGNLLEYEPNYPARFSDTLHYIADRIYPSARSMMMSKDVSGLSNRPSDSSPVNGNSAQSGSLRSSRVSPIVASTFTSPNFPALAVQNGRTTPPRSAGLQTVQDPRTATPQTPRQVAPRAEPRASRTPNRVSRPRESFHGVSHQQNSPQRTVQPISSARGTKRTADDAGIIELTHEINEADKNLDHHEFEKDARQEQFKLDKELNTQDLEAKLAAAEASIRAEMEARLVKLKQEHDAERSQWLQKAEAEYQDFLDGWEAEHVQLRESRERVAARRKAMRHENFRRSSLNVDQDRN